MRQPEYDRLTDFTLGLAPVPSWHTVDGNDLFGFYWRNRFVQQRWTSEMERLRRVVQWSGLEADRKKYEAEVSALPPASIVRHKLHGFLAFFGGFNNCGLGEFIATFEDGDASSEYISDYAPVNGRWPSE